MARPSLTDPTRLAAVKATRPVDTPAEENFAQFTRLAQRVLGVEMAIITLVLDDRQFYKSGVGLPEPLASNHGSPLAVSLCRIVIERREPLMICDGPNDPEFFEHPAIINDGITSYYGVPLRDDSAQILGTLCVANSTPRAWNDEDFATLSTLAYAVSNAIRLHQSEAARAVALKSARYDNALLDCILDTTIAAITILDPNGEILFCNNAAERVLGLKPSKVAGLSYDAPAWHSTDVDGNPWPDENSPFRRVLATDGPVHDIRHAIEWPNGTRRILSVSGAPLRDDSGKISRLVFLVTDVTEQHAVNQRLSRVAQQFSKSFCLSLNWVILCHYENRKIVEVSEGLTTSLGVSRFDCVGRRLDDIGAHFSSSKINELFSVSPATPESDLIELRLQATDQRLRLIEVRSQLIEVGSDKFLSISGQDLTDQRSEKQRRAFLEHQLREAQKAEIAGQLAGGLAHDFNNILTEIIGNSEIAGLKLPPSHAAQKFIGLIKKAGQRAAEQIRQILALSRKEQPTIGRVNIGRTIEESTSLLRSQNPSSLQINVELPSENIYVFGNAAQIDQILTNLFNNARQAIGEQGKIEVRLISLQPSDVDDLGASDAVVIEVEDSGTGIDPVHLPLVFEPYFTTKEAGAGTGIGLATARTIARSFNGELTVDSQLGHGATFRLLLPRDRDQSGPGNSSNPPFPIPVPPSSARLHVLLVDDKQEVLLTSLMILEQLGHKVESTQDPQAALESISAHPETFDLLITDNLMPGLTGLELIEQLRHRNIDTPAILISGFGTTRKQIEKLAANRASFVPKPFTISEIAEAIAQTIKL